MISALMSLGSDKETIFLFEFLVNLAMKNEFEQLTDAVYDGLSCSLNSLNLFNGKPELKNFCLKNSEKIILAILKNFLGKISD